MDEIRDFPPVIRRALARATGCDSCGLRELTGMERMLLSRYVRNVNIKDVRKPVRVSTAALSVALHVSDRTLLRIKTELIAKGWLVTHQVQSRRRGMQISDVTLTERALAVLRGTCRRRTRKRPVILPPGAGPGAAVLQKSCRLESDS